MNVVVLTLESSQHVPDQWLPEDRGGDRVGGWQGGRRKPFRKRKDRVTILVSAIVSQVYAIVKTDQMVHLNMKLVVCQSHLHKAVILKWI